jgi:hypothetical protein
MPLDSDSVRALAHAGLNRLAAIHEIAVAAPAMPAKVSGPEAAAWRDGYHLTAPIACVIAARIKL